MQSGLLTFMMIDTVNAKIAIDRGALKGLFVTDTTRYPPLPDMPTAAEAGLPDVLLTTWTGLYVPKGTPREIVNKINADVRTVAAKPEVMARLDAMGSRAEADEPRRIRRLHALREGALGQDHPSRQHQARVGDRHARIPERQQGPPHPPRGRRERALRDHHRRQADADHRRGGRRHRSRRSRCRNRQQDEVHRALAENCVIFFRDQHITLDQHVAFGRLFGDLHVHPAAPHEQGRPELMIIHADKD